MQAFHSTLHRNRHSELHHSIEPVLQIHHPTWTFPEAVPADTSGIYIYSDYALWPFQPLYRPWHWRQLLYVYR